MSKQRSPAIPNIPALAEAEGFEHFDFTNWYGLFAPAGVSSLVLNKLTKAISQAWKDPNVRELLKAQAAEPVGNTPAEFQEFIKAESIKYAKIMQPHLGDVMRSFGLCRVVPAIHALKKSTERSFGRHNPAIFPNRPSRPLGGNNGTEE